MANCSRYDSLWWNLIKISSVICTIFGSSYLGAIHLSYRSHYYSINGPGQVSVQDFAEDLNTMVCQGYTVTPFSKSNIFLLNGKAQVDYEDRNVVKRYTADLVLGKNNAFYLLEGSNIHVNACRQYKQFDPYRGPVDILIFKGNDDWSRWKDGSCADCYLKRKSIKYGLFCNASHPTLNYNVTERNSYYVAVAKREGFSTSLNWVNAELTISGTTFNIEKATQVLIDEDNVDFNLTYDSDIDIVIWSPDDSMYSSFGSECHYRVIFLVGIFIVVPVGICLLLFTCCGIIVCCSSDNKKSARPRRDKQSTNKHPPVYDKSKQATNTHPPTNDKAKLTFNELPPSYDSVGRGNVIRVV